MKKFKKVSSLVMGILLIISTLTVTALPSEGLPGYSKSPKQHSSKMRKLKAVVKFDGKQFIIINKNHFSWTEVKMEVNAQLLTPGYILRVDRISPIYVYTFGALEFAKPNGERLNPFRIKPLNFTITCICNVRRNKEGFWYGEWK